MAGTVYFVFLDGIGLGPLHEANPFSQLSLPAFERLAGGQSWSTASDAFVRTDHVFRSLDATLGVQGLPQSGTGQATLFTGVNCAALAGRHFGPFPHSATRSALAKQSVFRRLLALDLDVEEPAAFLNAYPDRFFSYVARTDRWTVTTRCCLDAGLRIRTHDDLVRAQALSADLTACTWPQDDPRLEPVPEQEAGRRFADLGRDHALVLFEYFHTDKAGHSQDPERASHVLTAIDRFFHGFLAHFNRVRDVLVVSSDHGNLEDLSTKTHTRNPVPLVAYGHGAEHFASARDLTDVTPAVVRAVRAFYA